MKDKNILILIIMFLVLTLVCLTPWINGKDGNGYYALTHSVVINKDLDLREEATYLVEEKGNNVVKEDVFTQKFYTQYTIGTAIFQTPFFILGHVISLITNHTTDGWSIIYIYMVCLGSALCGFLGILLMYKLLKKYFDKKIALLSIISIWLGSNLFYYMFFEPALSHSFSFFTTSLFLYYFFCKEKKFWLLGLISGLMVLVRPQNIIFLVLFLTTFKVKQIKGYIISAIIFCLTLTPQLLLLKYLHNSFTTPYNGIFMLPVNILKVLFSTQHGLFIWTPILLFSFIGLFFLKQNKKGLILVFLLNLLIVGSWNYWYGAQSFSNRMFVNVLPILMIGLAMLLTKLNKYIKLRYLILVCGLFIVWNLDMIIMYATRMISSEAAVPIKEMLYNGFIKVPKEIFNILKGFLFNRGGYIK